MNKIVSIIFAVISFFIVSSIIFGFFIFKKYSENLPDYEQLKEYNPMVTTRLYASDGSLFTEFAKEKRIFTPIENIPKNLINAFLAAEDANFYRHSGIDPVAIFRTSIRNAIGILKGGHNTGGASTITQQVVKNLLLTKERTLQRKVKEAILAFRLTQTFPKDKILELYLNQIYLGAGSYGVAAAAQTYFNKSIDELTVEECALLAALPKAPSSLDPKRNKNNQIAKERRDWVIARMQEEGFIKSEEARVAEESPIKLNLSKDVEIAKADFFGDSVKKELTELYGSDNVFESGIVVRTTLDLNLQKIASKALESGIEDYDRKHGYRGSLGKIDVKKEDWKEKLLAFEVKKLYKPAWIKAVVTETSKDSATIATESADTGSITLASVKWAKKYIGVDSRGAVPKKITDVLNVGDVILVELKDKNYELRQIPEVNGAFIVMDPHTGRILAMMGGYVDAPNQFNRATQAMRQPGSTMKTFGYIAALENGFTPASIIIDEEVTLDQGSDLPPYKPTNYSGDFYGPTTLRKGLEMSRNVTTVRMAEQVGLEKVAEVVKRFGISDNPQPIYSLVLGSVETTALKLATAYATMVNGGKKITPSMIEKIQDRNGKVIYRNDKRTCYNCFAQDLSKDQMPELVMPSLDDPKEQITDPATAYQITSMLQGVVERGTAAKAKAGVGKIIAGKTGTTNNSYDSWFAGFSPDLVAVVYVGFDIPKTLGSEETGASISLPVFINFMKEALKDEPSKPFRVPAGVKFMKIDKTTGKEASPSTPKENVFFEVFKVDDEIEETEYVEEENLEDPEKEKKAAEDLNPSGIY